VTSQGGEWEKSREIVRKQWGRNREKVGKSKCVFLKPGHSPAEFKDTSDPTGFTFK
jgi:hypothetical protein